MAATYILYDPDYFIFGIGNIYMIIVLSMYIVYIRVIVTFVGLKKKMQ